MNKLSIPTAPIFRPLCEPARHKAAHGGRGSGKSHYFAGAMVEDALRFPGEAGEGMRGICGREIQKSLKESAKFLIESKIRAMGLGEAHGFRILHDRIITPGDGVIVFEGLQEHTADSIKSFEGFHRFWGEEAHTITEHSLALIRPTIRWEDKNRGMASELWWSWNPRRKVDAVDMMFRSSTPPTDSRCVQANWNDNPWFPNVLEQERQDCIRDNPDQYAHIWEGAYVTINKGAYFAMHLQKAREEGRISKVAFDPNLSVRLYCDIGGTGKKADSFAIWPAQFIGKEIRYRDYYEAQGQPAAVHLAWMRKMGYTPDVATIWLPHDGETQDKVFAVSYQSAFEQAGYDVEIVPNQGKGAAMDRVEQARKLFPAMWFDEKTCDAGLEALGWYHANYDEKRNLDLGPMHDWASHAADAFGMSAVAYEEPSFGWGSDYEIKRVVV